MKSYNNMYTYIYIYTNIYDNYKQYCKLQGQDVHRPAGDGHRVPQLDPRALLALREQRDLQRVKGAGLLLLT